MKINIDLIKTFPNLLTLYVSYKFNEFRCRISNFEDILFLKRHALNGKSDSTPTILNTKSCKGYKSKMLFGILNM